MMNYVRHESILEKMWLDGLYVSEECVPKSGEYRKLCHKLDDLLVQMEAEKEDGHVSLELWEAYKETKDGVNSLEQMEAFKTGFGLAVQLFADVWFQNTAE